MQVQTANKSAKKVAKKAFQLGDRVTWVSNNDNKVGTVVAVLKPGIDYTNFKNLSKAFFEDHVTSGYYEHLKYTRREIRDFLNRKKPDLVGMVKRFYKLTFSPAKGMKKDEYHYLVALDDISVDAPRLYHRTNGDTYTIWA